MKAYTPDEIRAANAARTKLRSIEPEKRKGKWRSLDDERLVPEPKSSFILFSIDRHASGDFKNMIAKDAGKLIGEEWTALGASEKQVRHSACDLHQNAD